MAASDVDMTSLRIRVSGRVQGVGYRDWAVIEATKLGLLGWVRNRANGTVELLASGPTKTVEIFVGLCIKGPGGLTRVADFELHRAEPPSEPGFKKLTTL